MNWSKLKIRVISAVVLVVVLLAITFAPEWIFSLAVAVASFVVLHEMMVTFKQETKRSIVIIDYIFAGLYIISGFFHASAGNQAVYMLTIFFVMTLLISSVLDHKEVDFNDVCASLFLVLYSVVFLLHLSFLRRLQNGLELVFLAFIGAWLPDTMAYFAGNLFGKRKLIEAISPNKTIAGAIGAVVGAVISYAIYGGVLSAIGHDVNFGRLLLLSLICGVVAQFGDLAASVMKRTYKTKDFGNLIPGHGGLVDRVDSLLFVTPVVYYFVVFFPVI